MYVICQQMALNLTFNWTKHQDYRNIDNTNGTAIIVYHQATSGEVLVTITKFLVALATRKVQVLTLLCHPSHQVQTWETSQAGWMCLVLDCCCISAHCWIKVALGMNLCFNCNLSLIN